MSPPPVQRLSKGRLLAFATVTTVLVLGVADWGIGRLERGGVLQTHRPDDAVQFVDGAVFAADGDLWRTTPYAEEWTVPSAFARAKGDGWRMFVYGGSWAMGTPWVHQGQGVERDGGVPSVLRAALGPGTEVVNIAAGSQNAHRVRRLVEQTIHHDVDVAFVATCNNEGALRPRWVREQLHKRGGYRFLASRLAPGVAASERSYYTPQSAESEALAAQFREGLEAIVAATARQGVPLLLATLPVNLRYAGLEDSPVDALPEDGDHPEPALSACVAVAVSLHRAGDFDGALEQLQGCEDAAEALRWRGLALAALGRPEEARPHLEQAVELRPRNRCRPSFNAIIRDVAAADHVVLVDLERAARELSPDGLPGEELFVDSCHMTREGYSAMADEVLRVGRAEGLLPR